MNKTDFSGVLVRAERLPEVRKLRGEDFLPVKVSVRLRHPINGVDTFVRDVSLFGASAGYVKRHAENGDIVIISNSYMEPFNYGTPDRPNWKEVCTISTKDGAMIEFAKDVRKKKEYVEPVESTAVRPVRKQLDERPQF